MGQLSRTESNLHYKNEQRIDDTIKKLELQLRNQNFRLSEERRIVAEVDKLKRSKKVLEYVDPFVVVICIGSNCCCWCLYLEHGKYVFWQQIIVNCLLIG